MSPSDESTTNAGASLPARRGEESSSDVHALVIAWSLAEPHRVGEVALLADDGATMLLGRGGPHDDDPAPRMAFFQQRPWGTAPASPLVDKGISRRQLLVEPKGGELLVTRLGRCRVLINGEETERGRIRPGDTLALENHVILLHVRRAATMPAMRAYPARHVPPFGEADSFGLVGESPVLWALRDELAFHAKGDAHVLVFGASGTGKELAANALHGLSRRGKRPMVRRNAATFPEGLIDAELFGNTKNYPNAGMPERQGLIGEANQSTLFLDEIGELPTDLQAHLLRVLDGGEYHRLGESTSRTADLRIVAATNRQSWELKQDFSARFPVRVALPGLHERREDIPLLLRHLFRMARKRAPDLLEPFLDGDGLPRVDACLVQHVLRHPFTFHVRELEELLTRAIAGSRGGFISLAGMAPAPPAPASAPTASEPPHAPSTHEPTRDQIVASLERHGGSLTKASRDLGLKNRFVLYRLLKKHGIKGAGQGSAA